MGKTVRHIIYTESFNSTDTVQIKTVGYIFAYVYFMCMAISPVYISALHVWLVLSEDRREYGMFCSRTGVGCWE